MSDLPIMYPPLTRSMPVADVALDGDTLEAMFVPWDVSTTIYGEEPEPFEEGFRRTAFDAQIEKYPESIRNIALMPRHGSSETFGHARSIRPESAGLFGALGILPSRVADVRSMVDAGIDAVSIEFHPLQRNPRRGQIRWRDRAFLTGIVLTATPAYSDARVLAMREEQIAARAEADRIARLAALDAEIAELRAAGDRWRRA